MGFSVVHHNAEQLQWMPILAAEVVYMGSIVSVVTATPGEGVSTWPAATGHNTTTAKDVPLGIVVGTNVVPGNIAYSSTYKAEYITQVAAGAVYGSTTNYQGVDGEYPVGDRQAYALVHRITAESVIRGPIFNAAFGTAPTEVTVTVASGGDGIGCTTGATDVACVNDFGTIYVRSGANKGIYRSIDTSNATAHVWVKAMPNDMAIGDKCVVINGLRPYGYSKMITDSEAMYIDCNAALSTHNVHIDVRRLDLSTAGSEYVEFTFAPETFETTRA